MIHNKVVATGVKLMFDWQRAMKLLTCEGKEYIQDKINIADNN